MSETEQQIEAHNRRTLWADAANHLSVAYQSIEQAQGALEDLGENVYAEQLEPHRDALRRAANDAAEQAGPSS